jgi:DNA-binding transcriptional ArsR family regulator
MNGTDHDEVRARRVLACLGVASRFRLVKTLAEAERCVGELAEAVGLSQSCTTRHLQELERVGIVRGHREGRRVRFRLCAEAPGLGGLLGWALRGVNLGSPSMAAGPPRLDPGHAPAESRAERAAGRDLRRGKSPRRPLPEQGPGQLAEEPPGRPGDPLEDGGEEHQGQVVATPVAALRPGDLEDYLL